MQVGVSGSQHRYHSELDGLRAFAALMVMVFHLAQDGLHIPGPITFGQTGVDLFFVLSGFLITSILLRSKQGDWSEVKTFYIRRSLRIFPLYFGYLLCSWLLSAAPSWEYWVYLQNLPAAWNIPLVGPSHFWSLSVEEQFYLVWPFLVLFAPRRWLVLILWGMIVTSAALRLFLFPHQISVFYLTVTRLDGLAAGALLAVGYRRNTLKQYRRLLELGVIACIVLMIGLGLAFRNEGSAWFACIKYLLSTGFYTCLIAVALLGNRINSVLRLRWLRFVGRISYGLYVFHPAIFAFCFAHLAGSPEWLQAGIGIVAAFSTSIASWYLVERPFIKLKEKLAPEVAGTPIAARAV